MTTQQQDDASDDEEAIEFVTYMDSDDDDEDPYYMAEHHRKTRTLYFNNRLQCSPVQIVRFCVPAFCILTIIVYTLSLVIIINKRKMAVP